MAGKRPATICSCGLKMKRIYTKIDSKYTGIGNGCVGCRSILWDNATAFDKAWAILKQRGDE